MKAPDSKGSTDILENLDGQLADLKKQYLDLLDRLAIHPKDISQDAPAYYSTEALNTLYAIEYKIVVLQQHSGNNEFGWCEQKREKKLSAFKKQKNEVVAQLLSELKTKYSNLLEASITIPKKYFIKRSGYYDNQSLHELSLIEENIKCTYYNMSMTYDNWCEVEKSKALSKYAITSTNLLVQVFTKIGIPAAIIIGSGTAGTSYLTSLNAIEQFENTIQLGEQKVSDGQYGAALQLFNHAKISYDGSFRNSHYSDIADKHVTANIDKAVKSCTEMIQEKELLSANNLISSLPQDVIEENASNAGKIKTLHILLESAVNEGLDVLISNISANNGHLDANTREYLNELIAISPNDYWLNFIRNKEK